MKYFISCGELSGDRIAAQLARELLAKPGTVIKALGGPHLEQAGVENVLHIDALQVMGWTEVLYKLPEILQLLHNTKREILKFRPDTVILVDNPSFNLRLAQWCKSHNIKVVYLIPPKVWASRPKRIHKLQSFCDQVLSLFPFEEEYLKSEGVKAKYYGHPLVEELGYLNRDPNYRSKLKLDTRPILSILPGSRNQEIKYILPTLLEAASTFLIDYNIVISIAPIIQADNILALIPDFLKSQVHLTKSSSIQLLQNSELSLITSGTATLEAAILKIPHICCYKMNPINYQIGKRIIRSKFISLPNIILNQQLTPELIQHRCTPANIRDEINTLKDPTQRSLQSIGFEKIVNTLYRKNSISSLAQAISSER